MMKYLDLIAAPFLKHQWIRFVLVGGTGAVVEVGLFSGLYRSGLGTISSNLIAFHMAFFLCFILHYQYTYRRPYKNFQRLASAFVKYVFLMYAQLTVGTVLLFVMIDQMQWMPQLSKVIQIGVVTPLSYVVQRLNIFRAGEI